MTISLRSDVAMPSNLPATSGHGGGDQGPPAPVPTHGMPEAPGPAPAGPAPTDDSPWTPGHVRYSFSKGTALAWGGGFTGVGLLAGGATGWAVAADGGKLGGDKAAMAVATGLAVAVVLDAVVAAVGGVNHLFHGHAFQDSRWVANPKFDASKFDEHLKTSTVNTTIDDWNGAEWLKSVESIHATRAEAERALTSPESVARSLQGEGGEHRAVVQLSGTGSDYADTAPRESHDPVRWGVVEVASGRRPSTAASKVDFNAISELERTRHTDTAEETRGDQVWMVTIRQDVVTRYDEHGEQVVAKGKRTVIDQHFDRYVSADSLTR